MDTLVLFVHGFDLAEPPAVRESYWGDAALRILAWEVCERTDFGFYFYPKYQGLDDATAGFRRVLLSYSNPLNVGARRKRLFRRRAGMYRRVVVVGHSLGALIARMAVLDALVDHKLPDGTLVLFAPAHNGLTTSPAEAQAIAQRRISRSSFWRTLIGAGEIVFPCLRDVPGTVARLHARMNGAREHSLTRAESVYQVRDDPFVRNAPFFSDAPAQTPPKTSHWSIHRTVLRRSWPLRRVMEACR